MLYAIGEILLVVIGILIAVQINTLIQNKKDSKLEKQYLNRFVEDLERDYEDISQLIMSAAANTKLCVDILQALDDDLSKYRENDSMYSIVVDSVRAENGKLYFENRSKTLRGTSFGSKLNGIKGFRGYDITTVTLNDLTSNGKMKVIQNELLRTEIQTYYSFMLSHFDYQSIDIIPNRKYYTQLTKDLGILPRSSLTLEEVKNLTKKDDRLITAIHHVFQSNLNQLRWSRNRREDIQKMKDKIEEEISKS